LIYQDLDFFTATFLLQSATYCNLSYSILSAKNIDISGF